MRISDWSSDVCSSDLRVHPTWHPLEAEQVLREERQVEADEEQPELPLAEALVEQAAEHLRPPVEEPREDREHDAAEEEDRKSDGEGKSVSIRVEHGGRRNIKKQKEKQ